MELVLRSGDRIKVTLKDSDGEFTIEYGERELTVTADLPDSDGREGVIYSERFADAHLHMTKGEHDGGQKADECG